MGGLVDEADSVLIVIDVQPRFLRKLEEPVGLAVEDRIRWLARLATILRIPLVVTEEEPERNGGTSAHVLSAIPDGQVRHEKGTFGLAACGSIVADLERHGRRTAVLCGLETDVCVAQSALGLLEAGWRVVAVEDAMASPGTSHEQGLARMRQAGVELLGVKGLAYEWLRTVERSWEVDAALAGDVPMGITL